jgi:hypothetical protein
VRRSRVWRVVVDVLRAIGRFTVDSLIATQFSVMVAPAVYEASASRLGGAVPSQEGPPISERLRPGRRRARRLSAAERRAWADLEQRLR